MRDGSDAIADWPILNALVNVAAGATWVSVHHGGGVGIGNSIHAGMVVLADGTDEMAERLERVLTTDPGWASSATSTPAIRRRTQPRSSTGSADRGTRSPGGDAPARPRPPPGRDAGPGTVPARGGDLGAVDVIEDAFVLCAGGTIEAVGRMRDLRSARRRRRGARRSRTVRGPRARRLPHPSGVRRRPRRGVLAPGRWGDVRGAARGRRRDPLDRRRDPTARRG